MDAQEYDIYFSGEIIQGHSSQQVRVAVGKMFNVSGEKLERLFSGTPVRVKAGVSQEIAIEYRVAFREAGALVQIRPSGATEPQPTVATTAAGSTPVTSGNDPDTHQLTRTQPHDDKLEVLPPRTGDLLDCAPPEATFDTPDLGRIDLAPEGTDIDDSTPAPEPDIDIGQLSMSAPNTGSLEEVQLKKKPQPIPDISHLKLDE